MTKAEFHISKGKILSVSVMGHSGFGHEGQDIVCASISGTLWMTINGLENVVKAKITYSESEAFITLKVHEESIDESQPLLESLRQFLCNLSIEYEDYLTVKEVHDNV